MKTKTHRSTRQRRAQLTATLPKTTEFLKSALTQGSALVRSARNKTHPKTGKRNTTHVQSAKIAQALKNAPVPWLMLGAGLVIAAGILGSSRARATTTALPNRPSMDLNVPANARAGMLSRPAAPEAPLAPLPVPPGTTEAATLWLNSGGSIWLSDETGQQLRELGTHPVQTGSEPQTGQTATHLKLVSANGQTHLYRLSQAVNTQNAVLTALRVTPTSAPQGNRVVPGSRSVSVGGAINLLMWQDGKHLWESRNTP